MDRYYTYVLFLGVVNVVNNDSTHWTGPHTKGRRSFEQESDELPYTIANQRRCLLLLFGHARNVSSSDLTNPHDNPFFWQRPRGPPLGWPPFLAIEIQTKG